MSKTIRYIVLAALALLWAMLPAYAAIQEEAKNFTLPDQAGRKVSLAQFKGQVVLIDFWATWCGPCRQSMPHLQKLHKNYAEDGLVVLGINLEGPDRSVLNYIEKGGYTFPILFDRGKQASRNYRVRGIPHSVLVDRKGFIQYTGHPLGIEDRLLQDLLATGTRDRKTGQIVAADPPAKAGGGKRQGRSRAAQRFFDEGTDQKRVGNFGRAAEAFLDAIEADPVYIEAHQEYVALMRRMGKTEALLTIYREWIAEDPENAVLHYAFGLALGEQDVAERERAFKKALALNQNFKEAQQALAALKR